MLPVPGVKFLIPSCNVATALSDWPGDFGVSHNALATGERTKGSRKCRTMRPSLSAAPLSSNDVVRGGGDSSAGSSSTLEHSKRGCKRRDHSSKAGTVQWRLPPRRRLLRLLCRTATPREMNNRTARLLVTAVQLQSLQPPKLKAQGAECSTWEITSVTLLLKRNVPNGPEIAR